MFYSIIFRQISAWTLIEWQNAGTYWCYYCVGGIEGIDQRTEEVVDDNVTPSLLFSEDAISTAANFPGLMLPL